MKQIGALFDGELANILFDGRNIICVPDYSNEFIANMFLHPFDELEIETYTYDERISVNLISDVYDGFFIKFFAERIFTKYADETYVFYDCINEILTMIYRLFINDSINFEIEEIKETKRFCSIVIRDSNTFVRSSRNESYIDSLENAIYKLVNYYYNVTFKK